MTKSLKYIPSLDGIRAFSVLIVFVSHAGFGDLVPGGFGVTVFFFLSGYLITSLLLEEYQYNNKINFGKFFLRRFFRLFPPLIFCLLIAYLLVFFGYLPGEISLKSIFAQVFYFANYYSIFFPESNGVPSGTGVLWSLSVEEHFYAIYPFALLAFLSIANYRNIAKIILSVCALVLMWRYFLVVFFEVDQVRTYYATDTRIDSILFGCVLALVKSPLNRAGCDSKLSPMEMLLLFLSISVVLTTFLYRGEVFRETARYTLQGLALMPFFYLAVSRARSRWFLLLNNRCAKRLGELSYTFYLFHYVVIKCLMFNFELKSGSFLLFAISFILTFIIADFFDRYADSYFRRVRKRLHS